MASAAGKQPCASRPRKPPAAAAYILRTQDNKYFLSSNTEKSQSPKYSSRMLWTNNRIYRLLSLISMRETVPYLPFHIQVIFNNIDAEFHQLNQFFFPLIRCLVSETVELNLWRHFSIQVENYQDLIPQIIEPLIRSTSTF